jgi:hypothetical protein
MKVTYKPFLLSVPKGTWTAESENVKGFWREEELCFSVAEIVLPVNRSFFFGASPPIIFHP